MELQDCALTLLKGMKTKTSTLKRKKTFFFVEVIPTDDPVVAFKDIDVAILVGAMPRREGMERKDLLKANAKIFETQGRALNEHAKKTVKVCKLCSFRISYSGLLRHVTSFHSKVCDIFSLP